MQQLTPCVAHRFASVRNIFEPQWNGFASKANSICPTLTLVFVLCRFTPISSRVWRDRCPVSSARRGRRRSSSRTSTPCKLLLCFLLSPSVCSFSPDLCCNPCSLLYSLLPAKSPLLPPPPAGIPSCRGNTRSAQETSLTWPRCRSHWSVDTFRHEQKYGKLTDIWL